MAKIDLFTGRYTLNNNYILRKGLGKFSIYNIQTASKTEITFQLYSVLHLFMYNCTNLTNLDNYFKLHGVEIDMNDINKIISLEYINKHKKL